MTQPQPVVGLKLLLLGACLTEDGVEEGREGSLNRVFFISVGSLSARGGGGEEQ